MKIKHLFTKEGRELTGEEYNAYPRPQLRRDSFFSLNGEWDFSYGNGEKAKITVPYPPESALSGICKDMGKLPQLIYERKFTLPKEFVQDRVILHFGAVDQICTVFLNGARLGRNVGGYNHFSFDITKHLQDENHLRVEVKDYLSNRVLPYGKQRRKRGGMWYTPISGIWQSVWIESVPQEYIKSIRITPKRNGAKLLFTGINDGEVKVQCPNKTRTFPIEHGICDITLDNAVKWSPINPYLYYFTAKAGKDSVKSYFAVRTLDVKEINGIPRLCLNDEPFFFHGVLDQGYFSDGIYTPASPSLYEKDILSMKALGFNTLRKHIKVEPDQFYYDCDRLGMVVFQDMVNNGSYSFIRDTALPTVISKRFPEGLMMRSKGERDSFINGMKKTVEQLYSFPCICYWTIFNEGWGQFDSDEMYEHLKELDSSRFIDSTSGWFKKKKSDVESLHIYFKRVKLPKSFDKPVVLSEFGGYSLKLTDHCANEKKTYGYKLFEEAGDLESAIVSLYEEEIIPAIDRGLCASIYTQLSDVEDETNGFLTYDREIVKVDNEPMLKIAKKLKI
ncbi:MAG: glycoside hydrolase family 2 [Clostridia bacterium]|nr:glycoside hydrolase family 2 [Clostridia bacterium]